MIGKIELQFYKDKTIVQTHMGKVFLHNDYIDDRTGDIYIYNLRQDILEHLSEKIEETLKYVAE